MDECGHSFRNIVCDNCDVRLYEVLRNQINRIKELEDHVDADGSKPDGLWVE